MRFSILCDINWESKVDQALRNLDIRELNKYLERKNIGSGLSGITICLMCRDPELKFKQRIRLSKKENKLYMDIMLDYNHFVQIENKQRQMIIGKSILNELPKTLKKYKLDDFSIENLKNGLKEYFEKIEWIKKRCTKQGVHHTDFRSICNFTAR